MIAFLRRLGLPVAAVGLGLALLGGGLALLGYDAGGGLSALGRGAFGSWYAVGSATLVRAVPLIVIGLGVAIAFRAGALNIGAEGQFAAGAVAATVLGLGLGEGPPVAVIPGVLAAGALAGAAWIGIAVMLRQRFGVQEVISTLLLNFVADAGVSYLVQGPLQESKHVYPQSDTIGLAARLPVLPGSRLHLGFLLAVLLAAGLAVAFRRTIWGFRTRAVGEAPLAAALAGGIDVGRTSAVALLWSGAFAGLAGALEVTGVTYALFQNLSPGYGFTAIAVALIAGLEPVAILVAGIGFGALEAGAAGMQRDAGIPAVAVNVVQATIIVVALVGVARSRRIRPEVAA